MLGNYNYESVNRFALGQIDLYSDLEIAIDNENIQPPIYLLSITLGYKVCLIIPFDWWTVMTIINAIRYWRIGNIASGYHQSY